MRAKKPPLTDKKARWAKNRNVVLQGTKLSYNASIQAWYVRSLRKLITKMTAETKQEIMKLFKKLPVETFTAATDESISSQARILMNQLLEKFESLFSKESKSLADTMMSRTLKSSDASVEASLKELSGGLTIKSNIMPAQLTEAVTASVAENVSLIKSIPNQYFKDITGAVMRSITSGAGLYDLVPEIKKYEGVTQRRAELIALDQTRKAYTSVNAIKLDKLGVTHFKWLHSGGGQHPRASHIAIKGMIFSFANCVAEQAALGVPKEDRGLPGVPINCKCTFSPVIEFNDG